MWQRIYSLGENKTPQEKEEARKQASQDDDANKEEVKAEGEPKTVPQHLNTSQLREHLELPIVVDQKMIHDILGVEYLVVHVQVNDV